MTTVKEKIAYLKGLVEGSDGTQDGHTRIIFNRMVGVLEDVAEELESVQADLQESRKYMDALDDDLWDLEEEIHGDFDDWEDEETLDVICPHCKEPVTVDLDELRAGEDARCPDCGEKVFYAESPDGSVPYVHETGPENR